MYFLQQIVFIQVKSFSSFNASGTPFSKTHFHLCPSIMARYEIILHKLCSKDKRKHKVESHLLCYKTLFNTSTVRPLLSGHPPLSGHFLKSRYICHLTAVLDTSIQGHLYLAAAATFLVS